MATEDSFETVSETLRRNIEERRTVLDIDRKKLSRDVGLGENTLGEFVSGRTQSINARSLPALAHKLDTTVSWLLGVDDDATKAVNAAHQRESAALDAIARIEKLLSLFAYASTAQTHVQDGIIGAIQNYLVAAGVKLDRTLVRLSRDKHDG